MPCARTKRLLCGRLGRCASNRLMRARGRRAWRWVPGGSGQSRRHPPSLGEPGDAPDPARPHAGQGTDLCSAPTRTHEDLHSQFSSMAKAPGEREVGLVCASGVCSPRLPAAPKVSSSGGAQPPRLPREAPAQMSLDPPGRHAAGSAWPGGSQCCPGVPGGAGAGAAEVKAETSGREKAQEWAASTKDK